MKKESFQNYLDKAERDITKWHLVNNGFDSSIFAFVFFPFVPCVCLTISAFLFSPAYSVWVICMSGTVKVFKGPQIRDGGMFKVKCSRGDNEATDWTEVFLYTWKQQEWHNGACQHGLLKARRYCIWSNFHLHERCLVDGESYACACVCTCSWTSGHLPAKWGHIWKVRAYWLVLTTSKCCLRVKTLF